MGPRNSLQNKICNLPDWSTIFPKFIFGKEGKLAGPTQVLPVRARGSALILKTAGNIKTSLRLLSFIDSDIVQLVWIYIHGRQWLIHSLGPNLFITWLARKHDFVDTTEMPLPWNMLYEGQITSGLCFCLTLLSFLSGGWCQAISSHGIPPFLAKTRILWMNFVHGMAFDDLAHCIARSSAGIMSAI